MIDSKTKLVGLIGWPVEHSLSPVMHNAAFDDLGLNWRYLPLPVPPGQVEAALQGIGALGFRGANVTVPHKQVVTSAVSSLTPSARGIGAVNTIIIEWRQGLTPILMGHNTDDTGFIRALRNGGFEPEDDGNIVVVGAGGGARAVIFGLLWSGSGEITVLNRTQKQAQALVNDLGSDAPCADRLRALPLTPETLVESARSADLLVNATTVGMWPHAEASIWPADVPIPSHLTVFDLVYNPLETCLLQHARRGGAHPIDGLGMLVWQGALAFDAWTGQGLAIEGIAAVMRPVCERVLRS
jgi:shikimate dehydrogenase